MKKHVLIPACFVLLSVLSNCGTTGQVVLTTIEPSPVTLSNSIKKIGIIDRSIPSEGDVVTTQIDAYLAAENRWFSEKGTDAAMTGLFDELLKDRRFEKVKLLDSIPDRMRNFGSDPGAIAWESVKALCESYDVDAIFSLAYYDTDTKVSIKKTSMLQADMMREKIKVKAQEITLETLIENGWRIYDPADRKVIDEIVFNDQIVSKAKGVDPVQAYRSMGDRREIILERSKGTGSNYGLRLLPHENAVSRSYYVRGSDKLVQANELVSSGDWIGAEELWILESENAEAKIRARGCHNLAVSNERNNSLEKAVNWVERALANYENKVSRAYLGVLKDRVARKDVLERQLAQLEFSK